MENQVSTKLNLFSFQLQFLDFQRFQKLFVHSVHPFSIQTITIPVTIFPLLAIISIARHMLLEEPLSFCSEIQNSDTGKKARFKNFHNIVHIVYTCSTLNCWAQHRACSIQAPVQKRSNMYRFVLPAAPS